MKIPDLVIRSVPGMAEYLVKQAINQRTNGAQLPGAIVPEANQEQAQSRVESIRTKLRSGQPLTHEEMETLKAHSPDLYQTAVLAEEERRNHLRDLRRSDSRREANRFHQQKIVLLGGGVRSRDPERAIILIGAVNHTYGCFCRSPEYTRLKA